MPPELTQDWETDSWRHRQNLVHCRTREKGAETPQETDLDLPGVSRILPQRRVSMVACCRAVGTECSTEFLEEVTIVFFISTVVWPQVK